jgi:tight adherence protein C
MVSLAILGALGGALAVRSVGSTRRQSRSRRLAEELPTVTDTLALHVLAGASVTGAITAFTDACRGVAAEELTKAITSNDGLEFGLRSASEETAYPDAARLYDLLGHAHRTGGRLADSLLDLSAEYRASRADELTAEGGRRALAAYGPILAFMIPVTFLFLMYPTLAGLNALSSAPWKEGNLMQGLRRDERGVTTVEWLGMAAIAVLVIAVLLPQVRSAAGDLWNSIVGQLTGFLA